MIKIRLTDEQLEIAKTNHWNWFKLKQLPKLEKIKDLPDTNKVVKDYFSYLFGDETKLKNLVVGSSSLLREEIQFALDNFQEIIGSSDVDDNDAIEKELKDLKKILPKQKYIEDDNWEVEYGRIFKLIAKSDYFQIKEFNECFCKTHVKNLIKDINIKIKGRKVNDLISSVFSYKNFSKKEGEWNAYKWVELLDLKTCPYCNRQFIHFYSKDEDDDEMRPALDHFYPKSRYPFLGISLFNLIPSCHVCNSSFKGEIDFFVEKHIHPFEETFGDHGKFSTDFKFKELGQDLVYDISYLTSVKDKSDFKLSLNISNENEELEEKISNSNTTFKIEALYNEHKDYVHEIIKKTLMYNQSRLDELMDSFDGILFSGKDELKELIMGNYLETEKQGDRVLAKLTQDIFDEFKIDEIWDEAVK